MVNPGDDISLKNDNEIDIHFSELNYLFISDFEERSERMLFEFIYTIENTINCNTRIKNVYYHNLARFDGIILLRYYAD